MQAASGTFVAATQSKERTNLAVVKADWLRDGSFVCYPGVYSDVYNNVYGGIGDIGTLQSVTNGGYVESIDVNRSLSTDLPEASKADAGYASADATVVLVGAVGGVSWSKVLGAYNNGLSRWAPRIGAPVTIDLGFRGQAGAEMLRQFTGKVRGCSVDPSSGSVTLACQDRREAFRTPVSLPTIVRDDYGTLRPGLNAQWMLDYIARQQGFYASPPIRPLSSVSATLHGSAWAEVGTFIGSSVVTSAYSYAVTSEQFTPDVDGLIFLGSNGVASYTMATPITLNNGSTVFIEAARFNPPSGASRWVALHHPGDTGWEVLIGCNGSTHVLTVEVRRGGVSSGVNNISLSSLTASFTHYIGVQITFTATGFVAQAKCDAVTGSVTGVVANSTGSPSIDAATVIADVPWTSGFQVTTETYTAGMFNDGFVPTASFEASLNELTATPTVDTSDPWEICQQIASAEQGIFGFDENGVLRFYNRNHLTGGAAVATITSAPSVAFANLKQAASDETVDGIANYVSVSAIPLALDPPGTTLWTLSELIGIPTGSFIALPIEFPGTQWTVTSTPYSANTLADGTGSVVSNLTLIYDLPLTATTRVLKVYNPNAFDVFVVNSSGDPALSIVGQLLRPALESGYTAIAQDVASQTTYGYQSIDVPANPWMQSQAAANTLAVALLAALKDPHPTLTGVEIVSDYRLQLADRVRVADPTGLVLDQDFWLIASSPKFSASDTGQSVTLRAV